MVTLLVSDSHGYAENIELAFAKEKPDLVIFLGDGYMDFEQFKKLTTVNTLQVCGNCDFGCDVLKSFVEVIEGVRVYITHGTKERVKQGFDGLIYEAASNDCKLALFGHTHCQEIQEFGGITYVNPGAMEDGRYATINFVNNKFEIQLKRL